MTSYLVTNHIHPVLDKTEEQMPNKAERKITSFASKKCDRSVGADRAVCLWHSGGDDDGS